MDFKVPGHVALTSEEKLLAAIVFGPDGEREWKDVADAMQWLFQSLLHRDAIPRIRLQMFEDPDLAELRGKSPKQAFEENGVRGDAITRHWDFKPYLDHFIHGPRLPKDIVDGLVRILNDDCGTSGMVMKQYECFARDSVRRHRLNRHSGAREFHRLAVEIGMGVEDARILRHAALGTR